MRRIQILHTLCDLYTSKLCGIGFVDPYTQESTIPKSLDINLARTISHCRLCPRSKIQNPKIGYINPNAKVIFIVEFAMGDGDVLLDSKSSQMLYNIANNVFQTQEFSVFSLLKCGTHESNEQERNQCKPYLIRQIQESSALCVIIFGNVVLESILGLDPSHKGTLLDVFGKKSVATYAISELLRNPTFKKEALKHFMLLQKFIK